MTNTELYKYLYYWPPSVCIFVCILLLYTRVSFDGLGLDGPLRKESLGFLFFTLSLVTYLTSEDPMLPF